MKYSKTVIIAFLFLFISCQSKKEEFRSKKIEVKSRENFEVFNARFHSDSVFQLSRVDFPIDGIFVSGFDRHNWTKENWEFLKIPVSDKNEIEDYQHSLVRSDTLVTEKFWINDSDFEVERQFKLINGKWFLVFYNDINL